MDVPPNTACVAAHPDSARVALTTRATENRFMDIPLGRFAKVRLKLWLGKGPPIISIRPVLRLMLKRDENVLEHIASLVPVRA